MKFLKIYGLQRTGTNCMEWLMRNNFAHLHVFKDGNVLGWKHGRPPEVIDWSGMDWDNQPIIPGIIEDYKLSIKGLEHEIQKAFDSDEILYLICVRDPYSWLHKNVNLRDILTWNKKNNWWLEHCENHNMCMIVDHQDLAIDYLYVLESIVDKFKLPRPESYCGITNVIGARQRMENLVFDNVFYANKMYIDNIDKSSRELIKNNIDLEIMDKLGFDIL